MSRVCCLWSVVAGVVLAVAALAVVTQRAANAAGEPAEAESFTGSGRGLAYAEAHIVAQATAIEVQWDDSIC